MRNAASKKWTVNSAEEKGSPSLLTQRQPKELLVCAPEFLKNIKEKSRRNRQWRQIKNTRRDDIQARLIQVAAVETRDLLNEELDGQVMLEIEGSDGNQKKRKIPPGHRSDRVSRKPQQLPYRSAARSTAVLRYVKLTNGTTPYPVTKAAKVHMKAKGGGTVAANLDQNIHVVEGAKRTTALFR